MKPNSLKVIDPASHKGCAGSSRDAVIAALRREVEATGGKRITLRQFLSLSGLGREDVFRNFPRWNDVFHEAGYNFRNPKAHIEDAELLEDWGRLARDLKRLPCHNDCKIKGRLNPKTLEKRFDGWNGVPKAFRTFAKEKPEWADVLPLLPAARRPGRKARMLSVGARARKRWSAGQPWGRRVFKHPLYGARLDCAVLEHAPVNELGVVFLFGSMAEHLGFLVQSMGMRFPDCEAKRMVGPDLWEKVRIEFEYESRNFKLHGHSSEGCDLIVCWTHNWPECPKNLEVIALKDELQRLMGAKPRRPPDLPQP